MELEDIKGMGKARIEKLKAVGISHPLDLLLHFPYKYVDLSSRVDLGALKTGDELSVCGTVKEEPKIKFLRKGLRMATVLLDTDYGDMEAVWFNQKYIKNAYPKGKTVYLFGKVKKFRNKISLSAPIALHPVGKNIVPIYRNLASLPQNVFAEAIDMLLSCARIHGYLPDELRTKYGLSTLDEAFRNIHRPDSIESANAAAYGVSLEKLGYTLSMFSIVKSMGGMRRKYAYPKGDSELAAAIRSLPYELTPNQKESLGEIVASLRGEGTMNRLLQGDVGCGKTIVALLSMYFAYLNGYQSVLMAPTEILARQHYKSAIDILEKSGAKAVLMCGSLSKSEREDALFKMRTGSADIVIGTHALISDDVEFSKLALIVTDEQQRFGVNQRGKLENKALGADTLVMTATPIPRTLALCMYGELEQSCIRSLPAGRPIIHTSVVPESKRESMFDYVVNRAQMGENTYLVCPRIESDEDENLVSAKSMYKYLKTKYPQESFGLMHGKMKDAEKAVVMENFASGRVRILVATTVIEVGIDVPSATNVIIFNSERYGLSQLHQLRGRVGRGKKESYCFLPIADSVPERLKYFCNCSDGFALSEYDFEMRGAGDFIGTRQHGDAGELPVKIDGALIAAAKAISDGMLGDEKIYAGLRSAVNDGTEQYVRSITMN